MLLQYLSDYTAGYDSLFVGSNELVYEYSAMQEWIVQHVISGRALLDDQTWDAFVYRHEALVADCRLLQDVSQRNSPLPLPTEVLAMFDTTAQARGKLQVRASV